MEAFLLCIFIYTFIVCFSLSFFYGRMLSRDVFYFIFPIKGLAARAYSLFLILFLMACLYVWAPLNMFIGQNVIYSNTVTIFVGVFLGSLIYFRSQKFKYKAYNKQIEFVWKKNYFLYFAVFILSLFTVGYFLFFNGPKIVETKTFSEIPGFSFEYPVFKGWESEGPYLNEDGSYSIRFIYPTPTSTKLPPAVKVVINKWRLLDYPKGNPPPLSPPSLSKQNPFNIPYELSANDNKLMGVGGGLSFMVDNNVIEISTKEQLSQESSADLGYSNDQFMKKIIETFRLKNNAIDVPSKLIAQLTWVSGNNQNTEEPNKIYEIKKGKVINLKDITVVRGEEKYNFEVVDIQPNLVILKQVADEMGNKNIEGYNNNNKGIYELKTGQTLIIGPNVPGGGPKWTISIK